MNMMGIAAIDEYAIVRPHGTSSATERLRIATGTVRTSGDTLITNEYKSSLYAPVKVIIPTEMSPGATSGTKTYQSAWIRLAPSIELPALVRVVVI